ncbi:DUF1190 domain-containing protein [Bosea sp. 2KB_26]|uniref:DUF1190 domain-containing protein n=1 Tax=Bosea sp. 2KB_26 TaxID=3237475 RepID=UPI003F923304
MKRSSQIGLAAVGVVLVAIAWPRSDDDAEDALVYNSLADCRAAGQMSGSQCEQRFNEASTTHLRDAKKFTNASACEAEYGSGSCQSAVWNGAQVVVPALAGIMLARSFAQGGGAALPLLPPTRQACPPGSLADECRQARSSSSSSGGGGTGGRSRAYSTASGQALVARNVSSTGVASMPSAASRGGFGSTSRSYSSSSSS